MRYKHRNNLTDGQLDLGFTKVRIEEDGTFKVPNNTPQAVLDRLKAVGHKPIDADTPEEQKQANKGTSDDKGTEYIPMENLEDLSRAEVYRAGMDVGVDLNWTGADAHSKDEMIEIIRSAILKS